MSGKIKYIKLKRSDIYGFGFSILGGAGSELPPVIYDIIEGSPAFNSNQLCSGDIILEINGQDVLTFTTKEVLNCLRLSTKEVLLKLKTDTHLKEKIIHLKQAPNNSEILRTAITQDDLHGVKQIVAKKGEDETEASGKELTISSQSQMKAGSPNETSCITLNSSETNFENSEPEKSNGCHLPEKRKKKSDESSSTSTATKPASQRSPCASSPPLSEDESDIESLHSFHYSPKAVDMPSAVRLAKRLFALDGFKKSDVSRHLSKNNEFSKAVAEEYLRYFDFRSDSLDVALRKFLDKFCLSGETQERERVLVHFSKRFLDCNPGTFNSQDAVHTLTCAIMLLNTDLHSQSIGRKMTCPEFIANLAELNDGENFSTDTLKAIYEAIRVEPLKWATDDDDDEGKATKGTEEGHRVVGSNPFLSVPSGSGVIYKKGYIMRKCCVEPNGKRTAFGKRSWKMWFCVIQDLVLYLHKDEQGAKRGPLPQVGQNAVRLHHALAQKAHDYSKKEHVFRLQTADQAEYLLQTSDSKELQAWIDAINFVAASLSAPPMPGAVGSQRKFQRPLLPCSITKLNVMEQYEDHTTRLRHIESDLDHLKSHPPDKAAKSMTISSHKEKEAYLTSEVKRYQIYVHLLRSRLEAAGGGVSHVGGAGCALGLNELPVFEAKRDELEVKEVDPEEMGAPAVIVPPPIPERPRHADSDEETEEKRIKNHNELEATEEKAIQTNEKPAKGERTNSKKEDEFKKELDKMIKEKEKRDKKREKEEMKKQAAVTKQWEKIGDNVVEVKRRGSTSSDDPRMGTFNRLSAIFKFNKLNIKGGRRSYYDVEQMEMLNRNLMDATKSSERNSDIGSFPSEDGWNEEKGSLGRSQSPSKSESESKPEPQPQPQQPPPPLPPKPSLNSPVRKNLVLLGLDA